MSEKTKTIIAYLIAILLFLGWLATRGCSDEINDLDDLNDLIPAIIEVESGGNPNALSEDNCRGLMQISEIVFKEYKDIASHGPWAILSPVNYWDDVTVLYKPEINKHIGRWYLRRLKDHYLKENYTIERLLAAYNGGITRLKEVNYDINKMPLETRKYIKKVLKLYEQNKKN